jgi:hypothetical protein
MAQNKVNNVYAYVDPDVPAAVRVEKLFKDREDQLEVIRQAEEKLFDIGMEAVKALIDAGRYDLFTINWDRIRTQMRRGSL